MKHVKPRAASAVATAVVGGVAASAVTAAVLAGAGPVGASTGEHFAYGGNAFGSHVTLGSLAHVGKTAYAPMCTTKAGTTHRNKTAKLNLGAAGYIGAVTSEMRSQHQGAVMRSAALHAHRINHTAQWCDQAQRGDDLRHGRAPRHALQHRRQLHLRRAAY